MSVVPKRRYAEYEQSHENPAAVPFPPAYPPNSRLGHDNGNYVCSRCLAIDLDSAFNVKVEGLYGTFITELGSSPEPLETSSCGFCHLLAEVRPDSPGPFDLYAFSSKLFEIEVSKHFGHPRIPGLHDTVLLSVIERREHKLANRDQTLERLRETGYICSLMDLHPSQFKFRGRLLNAEIADFDLIKTWLQTCRTYHTRLCSLEIVAPVPGFKVIDCITRNIIHLTRDSEYLALSYVWGSVSSETSHGSESILPELVPQVINDAIEVTRKLHYRYLWVDRYCIPQHNNDEKRAQIQLMGTIYKSAQATIIAAAGADATFGLPGAGFRRRRWQPRAIVGQHILCSTLPDPKLVISRSKWMSRGWTYQEAMLSRRRIIFIENQVYFECQAMHCSEAFPPPLQVLHTKDKKRFRAGLHPGLFQLTRLTQRHIPPWGVWDAIAAYSKRSLSFEKDALNAISGVFAVIENLEHPIFHFWGVPILPPLRWHSLRYGGAGSPEPTPGSLAHGFGNALLWHHKRPARRRPGFPSWSWVGWDGELYDEPGNRRLYSDPSYDGCSCNESGAIFCAETRSKKLLDWANLFRRLTLKEELEDLSWVLTIQAQTVKLRFVHCPEWPMQLNRAMRPGFYAHAEIGRKETKYHGTLYKCSLFSYLSLSKELDATLKSRLETEEFIGIILACSTEHSKDRVLVIDSSGNVGERIGVVDVYWNCAIRGVRQEHDDSEWMTFSHLCQTLDDWKLFETRRTVRLG